GAPVFRGVLPCDALRDVGRYAANDVDGALAEESACPGLRSEGDTGVAREVLRPMRPLAALEVQMVVDPGAPLLHEVRTTVSVRGGDPIETTAAQDALDVRPREHAPRALRQIAPWEAVGGRAWAQL